MPDGGRYLDDYQKRRATLLFATYTCVRFDSGLALSLLPLREMQQIPLELTYEDVKYSFKVSPRGPDTILLSIGEQEIEVKILQQADGSLFVSYGRESHRVFAREEGARLARVSASRAVRGRGCFAGSIARRARAWNGSRASSRSNRGRRAAERGRPRQRQGTTKDTTS